MSEHILRIAPAGTPRATILIVPPLFEEANRTRRTLVLAMRALAAGGFAAWLPDLPGQNESLVPLAHVDLDRWQEALAKVAAAVVGPVIMASVRGGALIDHQAQAAAWWRLAPVGGASLLRTLMRAQALPPKNTRRAVLPGNVRREPAAPKHGPEAARSQGKMKH